MCLRERAAKHAEVLRKDEDEPTVDLARASHHAVAGEGIRLVAHPEFVAAVRLEHVELFERPLIQQHLHPLSRRQPAARVLAFDPFGTTTLHRLLAVLGERLLERPLRLESVARDHCRAAKAPRDSRRSLELPTAERRHAILNMCKNANSL